MNMSVAISPEDINRTIAEAIAKSAIGEQLDRIVREQVEKLSKTYDNPLEKVVEKLIHDELHRLLTATYADKIKAFVTEKLTDAMMWEIFERMWRTIER